MKEIVGKVRTNALGWREITNARGYYVSPEGEVGRRIGENTYKVLKPQKHPTGYVSISVPCGAKGIRSKRNIHTIVAEAFLGRRPKGYVINHKNGVKTDNRVSNLEYVTRSENADHAIRLKLSKPCSPGGVNSGVAKLNDNAVRMILECKSLSNGQIAEIFNVNPTTIRDIRKGKVWKHVYRNGVQLQLF